METISYITLTTIGAIAMLHYFQGGPTAAKQWLVWLVTGTGPGQPARTSVALQSASQVPAVRTPAAAPVASGGGLFV